jgi:hypothetical protein
VPPICSDHELRSKGDPCQRLEPDHLLDHLTDANGQIRCRFRLVRKLEQIYKAARYSAVETPVHIQRDLCHVLGLCVKDVLWARVWRIPIQGGMFVLGIRGSGGGPVRSIGSEPDKGGNEHNARIPERPCHFAGCAEPSWFRGDNVGSKPLRGAWQARDSVCEAGR